MSYLKVVMMLTFLCKFLATNKRISSLSHGPSVSFAPLNIMDLYRAAGPYKTPKTCFFFLCLWDSIEPRTAHNVTCNERCESPVVSGTVSACRNDS